MKNLIIIKLTVLCILSFTPIILSQEPGMRKSFSDEITGRTFNNFRTDSTEVLFYQVFIQDEFLYDEPKNNAEAVYTLDSGTFVEVAEETGGSFIKIKALDKFHGIIEGWVRSNALKKEKYYAKPFGGSKKSSDTSISDLRKNPHWIRSGSAIVYSDSSRSAALAILKAGDPVFVKEFITEDYYPVYFKNGEGGLSEGFINTADISEYALIPNASTDIDELYKIYNPILIRNDLDKAGFISFKGISFKNKDVTEFTEDKVCKERSADTLSFRYSLSSNIHDIKKRTEIRNRPEKPSIAMYRFLPDENILTSRDTVKCRVIEIASVPRIAKITVGGIEESSVTNMISKLYITTLDNFGMDIVFHKEVEEFTFSYKKDISNGKIFDTKTDTEKVIKRLIAFRKH